MNRYLRQTSLPEVGETGQARLAAASVLVAGAGGLGATLLPLLTGAGVGRIALFDPDQVEETNLHRQTLFRMADLGRPKAQVAARSLQGLNPDCHIEPVTRALDPALARQAIGAADLVIDAADRFAVTYALSDLCLAAGKPLISASVLGRTGYVGGFCGPAPSYRALFPDLPPVARTCATAGVFGPAVAVLGALQAQMALSVLLGLAPSPLGQVLSVDLASWHVSGFRFDDAPEPEQAIPAVIGVADLGAEDLVVELRGEAELPVLAIPGSRRMEATEVAGLAPAPGQRVVFVCATGLRAWQAAQGLAALGHRHVAILVAA